MPRRSRKEKSPDKQIAVNKHTRTGHAYDKSLLRQRPMTVIHSTPRILLVQSPCCGRRFRVELILNGHGPEFDGYRMCKHCRAVWRLSVQILEKQGAFRVEFLPS